MALLGMIAIERMIANEITAPATYTKKIRQMTKRTHSTARQPFRSEPEIDHGLARDDRDRAHDRERDHRTGDIHEEDTPDDETHPQHRTPAVQIGARDRPWPCSG